MCLDHSKERLIGGIDRPEHLGKILLKRAREGESGIVVKDIGIACACLLDQDHVVVPDDKAIVLTLRLMPESNMLCCVRDEDHVCV